MSFDVRDTVALVTGANRGIGKVISSTLIREGARKVYAAVRRPRSVDPLVDEHGDAIVPLECDLEDEASVRAAAEAAADVQLVVNNAGVLERAGALADDAIETLQHEMDVNVYGLMRMARAFAPVLKRNGGGAFVQLNSVASLRSNGDFSTYCASKAAAYSITQALRDLLAEQGTLVVSVHPGPIDTDMADEAGLTDIAEPPSLVADALIEALRSGDFHVFPDSMARRMGDAYRGFAQAVVETDLAEAS